MLYPVEFYEPLWRTTKLRDCVVAKIEHCYFSTQSSSPMNSKIQLYMKGGGSFHKKYILSSDNRK